MNILIQQLDSLEGIVKSLEDPDIHYHYDMLARLGITRDDVPIYYQIRNNLSNTNLLKVLLMPSVDDSLFRNIILSYFARCKEVMR